jgi:hypothetical protein
MKTGRKLRRLPLMPPKKKYMSVRTLFKKTGLGAVIKKRLKSGYGMKAPPPPSSVLAVQNIWTKYWK